VVQLNDWLVYEMSVAVSHKPAENSVANYKDIWSNSRD